MITPNLIEWQRKLYNEGHKNRLNLVIHILSAPFYFAGVALIVYSFTVQSLNLGFTGLGLIVFTIVVQGIGHSKETERPVPFRSPLDFIARFTVENTLTFWRFLFSGDYFRNFNR
jgi:hypothetical protein